MNVERARHSLSRTSRTVSRVLMLLVATLAACKDVKHGGESDIADKRLQSAAESQYSYQAHLSRGSHSFAVTSEGHGSSRALSVVHESNGVLDSVKEEIDGAIVNAACADLDRDSVPEIYVFTQSAGSGSYASLYGYQFDGRSKQSFGLPELDKRHSAGYLGHDTLWVQDSLLVRRFPVYTEGDFNASASGGSRTFEYALLRNRAGAQHLQCLRTINSQ